MVKTGTRSLEEVDGNRRTGRGNDSTTNKYSFEGRMKDGPISKLMITKTGHRPSQYKNIVDTLPVLCADKNYWGINDFIQNKINLVETNFIPTYPDTNRWSNTRHVEIETVNPNIAPDTDTGLYPCIITLVQRTHVFDTNL